MSTRLQRLVLAAVLAAGAGTFGYAAGGLAGTGSHLRAAELAPLPESLPVDVREGPRELRERPCPDEARSTAAPEPEL
jgi:hypothetical protein